MSHRASRYGNQQIFVVSDECISTPDAIGASVMFHPNEAIVAPHGLRLLLSLEQAAYSKSISNITEINQTIAFQSSGEAPVLCVIPVGLPEKSLSWFILGLSGGAHRENNGAASSVTRAKRQRRENHTTCSVG